MGNQLEATQSSSDSDSDSSMEFNRAPDEVLMRFTRSYGVRTTVLSFFAHREEIKAQILGKIFYNRMIADVQTRVRRLQSTPFIIHKQDGTKIGVYDTFSGNTVQVTFNTPLIGSQCIQVDEEIFLY